MKISDLRIKTEQQLRDQLLELHKEQFNLRMQRAIGQLSKPDQMQKVRRDIARVNTALGEKGVRT
jgi:large subunit ribosomal protein L29